MSETTNTTTTTTENTAPETQAPAVSRDELPRKLFATREEALAAVPANPPKNTRAFEITVKGEVKGWILAIGYDPAISRAAQLDGYSASAGRSAAFRSSSRSGFVSLNRQRRLKYRSL